MYSYGSAQVRCGQGLSTLVKNMQTLGHFFEPLYLLQSLSTHSCKHILNPSVPLATQYYLCQCFCNLVYIVLPLEHCCTFRLLSDSIYTVHYGLMYILQSNIIKNTPPLCLNVLTTSSFIHSWVGLCAKLCILQTTSAPLLHKSRTRLSTRAYHIW